MKAVILAGGRGTRQYPVTKVINKHFLPVYNKPMIYYPLSVVMLLGIREIILVINPGDLNDYNILLGDGSKFGINIKYVIQEEPRGLAEGLILAEKFLDGASICYVLGDNIFYGHGLVDVLKEARKLVEEEGGACIFGYYVKDPERFGVAEIDGKGRVVSIEEKPEKPKSNYAVVGLYFYDFEAVDIAKNIKPSGRGELEITSVNEEYLRRGKLNIKILGRGFAWFDAGTCESFLEASQFVATIERRTGTMIGSVEEVAYRNGWITEKDLLELASEYPNEYGEYLRQLLKVEQRKW